MKTILLDTSILIEYLRTKGSKHQTILYVLTEKKHILTMSLVTYSELYSGKGIWENKGAQEQLEELFSYIKILPVEKNIAQEAGKIRAHTGINLLDALIAATAIAYDIPIATLNVKDFQHINGLQLLPHN